MSWPEDPDADAWLAASMASPEELAIHVEPIDGETMLVNSDAGAWRLRPVVDTKPLEEYEPGT